MEKIILSAICASRIGQDVMTAFIAQGSNMAVCLQGMKRTHFSLIEQDALLIDNANSAWLCL